LIRLGAQTIQESTAQELIHRNIQAVIHCQKSEDGKRRVSEIAIMKGIESGCYLLEHLIQGDAENYDRMTYYGLASS
jgi:Flp pilus assembly CpaF family ATPase